MYISLVSAALQPLLFGRPLDGPNRDRGQDPERHAPAGWYIIRQLQTPHSLTGL